MRPDYLLKASEDNLSIFECLIEMTSVVFALAAECGCHVSYNWNNMNDSPSKWAAKMGRKK
jgi:hypothetical protein